MTPHKGMVVTVVLVVSREGILSMHKFNCLLLLFVGIHLLITLRMVGRFPKRSTFIMSPPPGGSGVGRVNNASSPGGSNVSPPDGSGVDGEVRSNVSK